MVQKSSYNKALIIFNSICALVSLVWPKNNWWDWAFPLIFFGLGLTSYFAYKHNLAEEEYARRDKLLGHNKDVEDKRTVAVNSEKDIYYIGFCLSSRMRLIS
jgi:hypothetical protein